MKTAEVNGTNRVKEIEKTERVEIQALDVRYMKATVIGVTPLITNNPEGGMQKIAAKQLGEATAGYDKKDIQALFKSALYHLAPNEYGLPAEAFKATMLQAWCKGMKPDKKAIAQGVFVLGDGNQSLVKIVGTPEPHQSFPRNANGNPDFRIRAVFPTWKCTLNIQYDARQVSPSQLFALLQKAGFGVGVGDRRPGSPKSKTGTNGKFQLSNE